MNMGITRRVPYQRREHANRSPVHPSYFGLCAIGMPRCRSMVWPKLFSAYILIPRQALTKVCMTLYKAWANGLNSLPKIPLAFPFGCFPVYLSIKVFGRRYFKQCSDLGAPIIILSQLNCYSLQGPRIWFFSSSAVLKTQPTQWNFAPASHPMVLRAASDDDSNSGQVSKSLAH